MKMIGTASRSWRSKPLIPFMWTSSTRQAARPVDSHARNSGADAKPRATHRGVIVHDRDHRRIVHTQSSLHHSGWGEAGALLNLGDTRAEPGGRERRAIRPA